MITIIESLHLHPDDQQLLSRLKEGDREAFDALYRKYWKALFNSAYKRVAVREEAEEIIQDLFVGIWMKREQLEITTSFEAYLFGALRYRIYNLIRNKQVKEAYFDYLEHSPEKNQNDVEAHLYYEELSEALMVGVEKLPEKYKKVYELSRNEYFTYKEISKHLSIPLDTVEKHMGKALKMLREYLRDYGVMLLIWGAKFWN